LGKENYSWCVAECFILYSVFIYHARIIYLWESLTIFLWKTQLWKK
jgi:hypothetical protein